MHTGSPVTVTVGICANIPQCTRDQTLSSWCHFNVDGEARYQVQYVLFANTEYNIGL